MSRSVPPFGANLHQDQHRFVGDGVFDVAGYRAHLASLVGREVLVVFDSLAWAAEDGAEVVIPTGAAVVFLGFHDDEDGDITHGEVDWGGRRLDGVSLDTLRLPAD